MDYNNRSKKSNKRGRKPLKEELINDRFNKVLTLVKKGEKIKKSITALNLSPHVFYKHLTDAQKERLMAEKKSQTKKKLKTYHYQKVLDQTTKDEVFQNVIELIAKGYGITEAINELNITYGIFYGSITEKEKLILKQTKREFLLKKMNRK